MDNLGFRFEVDSFPSNKNETYYCEGTLNPSLGMSRSSFSQVYYLIPYGKVLLMIF